MSAYVYWLNAGTASPELVGGKGASLSRLIAAGFTVPAGFAITVEGHRRFLEACGLDREVAGVLAGAGDDSETLEGLTAALTEKAATAALPDDLVREIAAAYARLAAEAGPAAAVRSSAAGEDGVIASFAGLYDSYLNVRGVEKILAAVQRCYCSLWSRRAVLYRARRGLRQDEKMAVVVMALAPVEASGIAFTLHPVTGARDRVLINSAWGLGEAVVSGRVTPDSFTVARDSLALIEKEVARKEVAIYPRTDGEGTEERPLPREKVAAPSLTDDEACAVARLAASVEALAGSPQDIEWGIGGGQLYLLQSRAITTA